MQRSFKWSKEFIKTKWAKDSPELKFNGFVYNTTNLS